MTSIDDDIFSIPQSNLLELMFDRMPMGIAVFTPDLRLIRCNTTWREYVGRYTHTPVDDIVPGVHWGDIAPEALEAVEPISRRVLAGETIYQHAFKLNAHGVISYWDAVWSPLIRDGEIIGVVDVTTDATERELAYQTLEQRVRDRTREIERRRRVAESLRDTLAFLNAHRPLQETLEHIAEQTVRLLGNRGCAIYLLDGNVLRIKAATGLSREHVESIQVQIGQGTVGKSVEQRAPVYISHADESVIDTWDMPVESVDLIKTLMRQYRAIISAPLITKSQIYGAITLYYPEPRAFSEDDIDLVETFAEQISLAMENTRLRDIVEKSAAAAERGRLARDLHDSVTQTLFSASITAEVLPRLWEEDPDEGFTQLEELRMLTRGALAEMRTLLMELRPETLAKADLSTTLRHLVDAASGRADIPIKLTIEGDTALCAEVKVALYRIAQEALNNVAKHAEATHASVMLECAPDYAHLEIRDDGSGFTVGKVSPNHLGLSIMVERAESIGAALEIDSRSGGGTRIDVRWQPAESAQHANSGYINE
jgi:signal transduction histidine kinase